LQVKPSIPQPHPPLLRLQQGVSKVLHEGHELASHMGGGGGLSTHLLLMHIWVELQLIGQLSVLPQPSGLVPHSDELQLALGAHAHFMLLSQLPLVQSPSALHALVSAHLGQLPPQSTSVSSWFRILSVQLGLAQMKPGPQ